MDLWHVRTRMPTCLSANSSISNHQPVLKAVAARDPAKVKQFAHKWGYETHYDDWRRLIEDPAVDVVDIASPNDTHAEIAIAAAQAGKMILCEKPLARNLAGSTRDDGCGQKSRCAHDGLV